MYKLGQRILTKQQNTKHYQELRLIFSSSWGNGNTNTYNQTRPNESSLSNSPTTQTLLQTAATSLDRWNCELHALTQPNTAQCRTQSSGLTNTDTKISPLLLDPPPPDHPKIYLWVQISHPSLSLSLSSEDCLLSSAGDSCRQSAARNLQPRSICLCLCLSIWTIGGLCTYSGCMILWEGKEVPVI